MAVRIISKKERIRLALDEDSAVFVRRPTTLEVRSLMAKHTDQGVVGLAMGDELLERFVVDWEGVLDGDGEPVAFDPAARVEIELDNGEIKQVPLVMVLPQSAQEAVAEFLHKLVTGAVGFDGKPVAAEAAAAVPFADSASTSEL